MKSKILFRCYCSVSALLLGFYCLLPKPSFSIRENRVLADLTVDAPSEIPDTVSVYMRDRFPFRSFFIGAAAELSRLFIGEANGVIFTDDRMLKREESFDEAAAYRSLNAIAAVAAYGNIPLYTVIIPRPSDIAGRLESGYESPVANEVIAFTEEIGSIGTGALSLADYYKTDHHLTASGIEKLYRALCKSLGITERTPQSYRILTGFRGSVYRESGVYQFDTENISLPIFGEESSVYFSAEEKSLSLYRYNAVETGDGYTAFLGGNYGLAVLSKEDTAKETLLVIKDSYANACVPYLLQDYRVVLVDPRYFRGNIEDVIKAEKPTKMLVFAGVSLLLDGVSLPLSE